MAVAKLGGGEKAAFEKFMAGIRHAEEACVELAAYQERQEWMRVGMICKQVGDKAQQMQINTAIKRAGMN